jgi:hypothetical protein
MHIRIARSILAYNMSVVAGKLRLPLKESLQCGLWCFFLRYLYLRRLLNAVAICFSGGQKSNQAAVETNGATRATMNAEVRRQKASVKAEIPKLQKLALKKVSSDM